MGIFRERYGSKALDEIICYFMRTVMHIQNSGIEQLPLENSFEEPVKAFLELAMELIIQGETPEISRLILDTEYDMLLGRGAMTPETVLHLKMIKELSWHIHYDSDYYGYLLSTSNLWGNTVFEYASGTFYPSLPDDIKKKYHLADEIKQLPPEVRHLSGQYEVRRLTSEDVDAVYEVCRKNEMFYRYHPPFVTKESIAEDMRALPPGKEYNDKCFVGYFKEGILVAFMDLILNYPKEKTAYIGLFMVNTDLQGKGIGTDIIKECAAYLAGTGFEKIGLAVDKGNPQSEAFWIKNGFAKTGEEIPNDFSAYLPMEAVL